MIPLSAHRCNGESRPINGRPLTQIDVEGTKLDVEATFCYLALVEAVTVPLRPAVAWGKFRKLTSKPTIIV